MSWSLDFSDHLQGQSSSLQAHWPSCCLSHVPGVPTLGWLFLYLECSSFRQLNVCIPHFLLVIFSYHLSMISSLTPNSFYPISSFIFYNQHLTAFEYTTQLSYLLVYYLLSLELAIRNLFSYFGHCCNSRTMVCLTEVSQYLLSEWKMNALFPSSWVSKRP